MRALIVDGEEFGRGNMANMLRLYCPEVEIAGMAESAIAAYSLMSQVVYDIVFLDIHMPAGDGFSLLKSLENNSAKIIFVTAYEQYSLKALKAGAFDYILKPIDIEELQQAVTRLKNDIDLREAQQRQIEQYRQLIKPGKDLQKISIPHSKGVKVLNICDIIRLSADNNYTEIHLKGGRWVVSKTLKEFENSLNGDIFFRIHKSHIIHIAHLKEYINSGNGYVLMSDGAKIEISRRRSAAFMQFLHAAFK